MLRTLGCAGSVEFTLQRLTSGNQFGNRAVRDALIADRDLPFTRCDCSGERVDVVLSRGHSGTNYVGRDSQRICGAIAQQRIVELGWYAFQMRDQAKKRGPKPMHGEPMTKTVVSLDEMSRRKLRVLGEGNISAGIRRAAEMAYARYQSLTPMSESEQPDAERARQ